MTLTQLHNQDQALAVALIRNECCEWMTSNPNPLTVAEQLAFYHRTWMDEDFRVFIAHDPDSRPCGYGIVRKSGTRAILTGGLAEGFRGKGLGRQLFESLIDIAREMKLIPWLEVKRSNKRARRLYHSLGFRVVRNGWRIVQMEIS